MDRRDFLKIGVGSLTVGVVGDSLLANNVLAPATIPAPAEAHSPNAFNGVPVPRYTPRPVMVADVQDLLKVNLNGTWQFHPSPVAQWWKNSSLAGFKPIDVPGEWVMQGFTVAGGTGAAYRRTFSVPKQWKSHRVKLRCDGIYSDATVWINGRESGHHLGGFTPFELDITELLTFGESETIAVTVKGHSLADTLASASSYAQHDLGGITRKIYLFAVPEVNISDVHVVTVLDAQGDSAELTVDLELANDGNTTSAPAQVALEIRTPNGQTIMGAAPSVQFAPIPAGARRRGVIRITLIQPVKWDNEHPYLHTLQATLNIKGQSAETVAIRFGVRQVEVRAGQVLVNRRPVRLRGVCRHETDPLRGRSLSEPTWRQDVELFRAANCNVIRTSHYPPAEEFIEACDELGMFVEEEAPFCWVQQDGNAPGARAYTIQAGMEMAMRDRNHPSVIQWSLGNESNWSESFHQEAVAIRRLDATRPLVFEGGNPQPALLDITTWHYPNFTPPLPTEAWTPVAVPTALRSLAPPYAANRPDFCGEYSHLNCYNRREIFTDPGLRDFWVLGLTIMWDLLRTSKSIEGGTLWAGINDLFFLPPRGIASGYGPWGVIDGWRRPKPEYWNVKKVYSPLRIGRSADADKLTLVVENRNNFTDLSEYQFKWFMGEQSGIAVAHGQPGQTGTLTIEASGEPTADHPLKIEAYDARGVMVDVEAFTPPVQPLPPVKRRGGAFTIKRDIGTFVIRSASLAIEVDRHTGQFRHIHRHGSPVLIGGPTLLMMEQRSYNCDQILNSPPVLALDGRCRDWKAQQVDVTQTAAGVQLHIAGTYQQAVGAYTIDIAPSGIMTVSYNFAVKKPMTLWQRGLVFDIPVAMGNLSWRREALWSIYPHDHIGRPVGQAPAFSASPISDAWGSRSRPTWSWSDDNTTRGSHDFRSTKRNILEAALGADGKNAVRVRSDGHQHVRCWVAQDRVRMLIADFIDDGSPTCCTLRIIPAEHLASGSVVKGTVELEIR